MKKYLGFILVLISLLFIGPVKAEEGNFFADDNVSVEEAKDGTVFAAGNIVKSSSIIDGIGFFAGNNVTIKSTQDYLFAAGNNVTLEELNTKDAFVAGNTIEINKSIIRDLYAAASQIIVNSDIERNAFLAGNEVTISGKIQGNVTISAEKITIKDDAIIAGTLKYPEEAEIKISDKATIGEKETYKGEIEIEEKETIWTKIISTLRSFVSMFLIAVILLAVNKKLFTSIKSIKKDGKLALHLVYGFAFLVLVPIAAIIVMITIFGFPLSIISLLLYGILLYLSIIPTAYLFGEWILGKSIKSDYLIMLISLLVLYVVKLIPYLGGLVSFASLLFGLGTYSVVTIKTIKK